MKTIKIHTKQEYEEMTKNSSRILVENDINHNNLLIKELEELNKISNSYLDKWGRLV